MKRIFIALIAALLLVSGVGLETSHAAEPVTIGIQPLYETVNLVRADIEKSGSNVNAWIRGSISDKAVTKVTVVTKIYKDDKLVKTNTDTSAYSTSSFYSATSHTYAKGTYYADFTIKVYKGSKVIETLEFSTGTKKL